MSLYNLILGMDTDADSLLNMLGKSRDDFGRFRNAYIEKGEDCPPHIVIYTRCGGGNREYYQSVFEEMSMHPNFIGTEDDDGEAYVPEGWYEATAGDDNFRVYPTEFQPLPPTPNSPSGSE